MRTRLIIRATEKLYTLTKRAAVSERYQDHRERALVVFEDLATNLGKIATRIGAPDWLMVMEKVHFLHTEAVQAEERRSGTFTHIGSETALVTSLHALAAVLGYALADIEAAADDDAALAAVEGGEPVREAAE